MIALELIAVALISVAGGVCANAFYQCIYLGFGSKHFNFFKQLAKNYNHEQLFSTDTVAICISICVCALIWYAWVRYYERRGKFRKGEEHGSSKWAKLKAIVKYSDKKYKDNNILLTEHASIRLKNRKFNLKTDTNNNVLIVGGPGTGKTRYFVKPNLMQGNASFFLTDPKGTLIYEMGNLMEQMGYEVRAFNTINFDESMHFNPFEYLKTEQDILTFVGCLIQNTNPDKKSGGGDPFWEKSEQLLYVALIHYLLHHCREEERNIGGLLKLLALADAKENDEDYNSPLDYIFDELESGKRLCKSITVADNTDTDYRGFVDTGGESWEYEKIGEPIKPDDDFGLSSYRQFKVAAGKTLKSIMISCNVRMKPFDIAEVKELLSYDEMRFKDMGRPGAKVVLFASMSDTDSTFDFIFATLMQLALNTLCVQALDEFKGGLPTCVHFIFDEFANIGKIPDFQKMITVTRSRNIAISMILQSLSQLNENYGKENSSTIINACDTFLYLGGKENNTNKEIAEMVGKQTVSTISLNESKGKNGSYSHNQGLVGRDLIQAAEIARMPRDEALLLVNGALPYKDKKYPLQKHSRYEQLEKSSENGLYDIKEIFKQKQLKLEKELEEVKEMSEGELDDEFNALRDMQLYEPCRDPEQERLYQEYYLKNR